MNTTEKPSIVQQTLQHQIDRLKERIERDEAEANHYQKMADDLRAQAAGMRRDCSAMEDFLEGMMLFDNPTAQDRVVTIFAGDAQQPNGDLPR